MEKELKSLRNQVNKIIKNLNRNDLDWTVQFSINSTRPDRVNYCAQIESPANGLQPVTWVCKSLDELKAGLKTAEKSLDQDAVDKAWHESEIERAEALIKFHKEALEDGKEGESEDLPRI